ncbi:MAG: hypothetical protein K1X47_11405 [Cyclobacteriaceae bacterium]|nr:hypothetical protein [Cyclobacteriaceae bacterium]
MNPGVHVQPSLALAAALLSFGMLLNYPSMAQTDGQAVSVSGNIQVTQNGISPVPAFSLGRPALMANARVRKGRFYVQPEMNFGLDARPWTINLRPGFDVIRRQKYTITLGANLSLFFKRLGPNVLQQEYEVQRYSLFELNTEFRLRENRKLIFLYWHTTRNDQYKFHFGQFTMLTYEMKNLRLGKKGSLTIRANAFYVNNQVPFVGFFLSHITTYQRERWKFNLFGQTVFPLRAEPNGGILWNTGVNIPF